jgi:hypothetical protein
MTIPLPDAIVRLGLIQVGWQDCYGNVFPLGARKWTPGLSRAMGSADWRDADSSDWSPVYGYPASGIPRP